MNTAVDGTASEVRDRYRTRFSGWTPSEASPCPRTVAGRRCRWSSRYEDPCICMAYSQLLDHAQMWRTEGGERVLTVEPYELDGKKLAAFVADCDALGLRVLLQGHSPWNPDETCLLTVRPQEGPD